MAFFNLETEATGSLNTKIKVLQRYVYSFFRHITLKKLFNFLKIEYSIIIKKSIISGFPYIIKIETTNHCNLRCAICYHGLNKLPAIRTSEGKMSFREIKKIIDELSNYAIKVNLYGYGEPFLYPDIFAVIHYISNKNIGVTVASNMNYKNTGYTEKIIRSGLEHLIFSCHGATEKTHSICMEGGDFKLALENVRELVRAKKENKTKYPFIDWQFCLTSYTDNKGEKKTAINIARSIGVDTIRFVKAYLPERMLKEWGSSLNYIYKKIGCTWPYRAVYITWNGTVLPCCKSIYNEYNNFGNIFTAHFKDIWNNRKYQHSRRVINNQSPIRNIKTLCNFCERLDPDKRNEWL